MNFNCPDSLKAKHAQYVRDMQDGRLTYHYVTSACEYDVHQAIGASGGWQFIHYHKALSDSIETKLSCKIGQEHGFNSSGKPLIVGGVQNSMQQVTYWPKQAQMRVSRLM